MTTRNQWSKALARVGLLALLGGAVSDCAADVVPPLVPVNPALAIDADPLALFPPGAVALGDLDTHTFYTSGSLGGQVATLAESMLPLGNEVGFSAARDVDHVWVAAYVGATTDAVAILAGRFDAAAMQAAVASHAAGRSGLPWATAPYAGRTLYTTANVAFAPITAHTLAAGNESAVRRVLDRLAQPAVQPGSQPGAVQSPRALPDWMLKTVEAPGSAFALAADVAAIPPAALQGWSMPGAMAGLSRLAVIGDFHPPGVNVAGTLTYTDPAKATSGAASLQQLAAIVAVAGQIGAAPKMQNLTITPDGPSVACKFVLDEESLKRSLASVMKLFPGAPARPPG
jgi:hypothetical protein